MSIDTTIARLTAGLDRDEAIAQAAEEFWETGFMLHTSEVQWELGEKAFNHLRQQNPSHTLRTVEAIRKVIADFEATTAARDVLDDNELGRIAAVRAEALWSVLSALAGIYPEPTEES